MGHSDRGGAIIGKTRIYHQMVGKRYRPFHDSLPYGTGSPNNRIHPCASGSFHIRNCECADTACFDYPVSSYTTTYVRPLYVHNKRLHVVDSVQGGAGFLHIRILVGGAGVNTPLSRE